MSLFTQITIGTCTKCGTEVSLNTLPNHDCKALTVLEYIEKLEKQSFVGWSEDSISCYLTAMRSIKEKLKQYVQNL